MDSECRTRRWASCTGYPQCDLLILNAARGHWRDGHFAEGRGCMVAGFSGLSAVAVTFMNLLETTKLVKTYGGRTVVDQVGFVLHQQEIVGILGRNGAGKTTTFRMIMGMVKPDSGAVAFDAYDITHLPMYKRARKGIGYLSQERSDFRRLTVWQNLQAILETLNISRNERTKRANLLLDQYGLLKVRNQRAETLSGGERRKLEIARSLVTQPKLILLDEPFSGVDPIAVEFLQRLVVRLKIEL